MQPDAVASATRFQLLEPQVLPEGTPAVVAEGAAEWIGGA
jgi:hypothetical protein